MKVILLLISGIILSSNWNYFIKNINKNNKSLTNYQKNNNNFYSNYEKDEGKIMLQINILNDAIKRNNYMYKNYTKVFEHNINYIKNQKDSIKNNINFANSSIMHEIDILNSMSNIIFNHPYNYIQFFENKNYTLPKIIIPNNKNISLSINNIETYAYTLNSSKATISNIFYQSEESVIGIGNISSLISASKILIISKVNFNYNNIYYFSNISDSLTASNQFKNFYTSYNKANSIENNQFINNRDINSLNKSNNNIAFSLLHNIVVDYIKNHPYVDTASFGGLMTMFVVGAIAILIIHNCRKIMKARKRDGNDETVASNNEDPLPVVYEPIYINTGGYAKNEESSVRHVGVVTDNDEVETSFLDNIKSMLTHNTDPMITLFDSNDEFNNKFFKLLYNYNEGKNLAEYKDFVSQIFNYLIFQKLEYTEISFLNRNFNRIVSRNINDRIMWRFNIWKSEHPAGTYPFYFSLLSTASSIDEKKLVPNTDALKTTNGWFEIPSFRQKVNTYEHSDVEKEHISGHLQNFNDLLNILQLEIPHYESKSLLVLKGLNSDEIRSLTVEITSDGVLNDLQEVIKEYIKHLSSKIVNPNWGVISIRPGQAKVVSPVIRSTYRNKNYTNMFFKNTNIVDRKLADINHLGVDGDQVAWRLAVAFSGY